MTLPTGEQYELGFVQQSAVVTEVGATLRTYDIADRAVVDGFPASEMAGGGRGQVLAPWPNRVRDGRWSWQGTNHQLALSEPDRHNAIHGLVRWQSWDVTERSEAAVTLATTVWPQKGYPSRLALAITYTLGADGLAVSLTARNEGDAAAPYGAGFHPYVSALTDLVDDSVLTLPAATRITVDDRLIPVGEVPVTGTAYDFTDPRPVGDLVIDDAFTGLEHDEHGRVTVTLTAPDGGHGTAVWGGPAVHYLQVFSGDTLPAGRRRRGLAVEPMSCPANAFVSGDGLVVLEPAESHALTWGIRAW